MLDDLTEPPPAALDSAPPARLEVQNLTWGSGGKSILRGISLAAAAGRKIGVVGPNGSGKTSMLRCIYRHHRPTAGSVLIDGTDIWSISPRACARRIAAVLQEIPADFGFSVAEIVQMGRIPFGERMAGGRYADRSRVGQALRTVGLAPLARRDFATLSGGEKQRALIARALVQTPGLLVLDEPTNHLDIRHQIDALRLLKKLPVTVLVTLHDLNLAAAFCDEIYVMDHGRFVANGPPAEVFQPALVRHVFGVAADIDTPRDHARPRLHFEQL